MALKGKRVMVVMGINKGFVGTVTHADRDSCRIVSDFDNLGELGIYDRIENIVRAKE
jgi:hypothetical protein